MTLAFFPGGMPGIGEIGIIVLALVLLFGARKLPELARALGASLKEFKKGRQEGASAPPDKSNEKKNDSVAP